MEYTVNIQKLLPFALVSFTFITIQGCGGGSSNTMDQTTDVTAPILNMKGSTPLLLDLGVDLLIQVHLPLTTSMEILAI